MRLDKYLANSGIGTRSEVKKIIEQKRILVNEKIITDSSYNILENDIVKFDNIIVNYRKFIYLMLNKPKNFISATTDNKHKTVLDLVKNFKTYKLFPVGRLDIDTEGLLILTNDGKFSHNVISPKKEIYKKYFVKLKNEILVNDIKNIEKGIKLDDGYITKKSFIKLLSNNELYISISEGKFHQIKRMFKAINNEVIYLKRIQIGQLKLDDNLKLGEYKELNYNELERIFI